MSIDFDDTMYVFTHGHAPHGRGGWAFSTNKKMLDPVWVPGSMLYSDAKVWIRAYMREKYGRDADGTLYVCT